MPALKNSGEELNAHHELLELLDQAKELLKQKAKRRPRKQKTASSKPPVSLSDEELLKIFSAAKTRRLRDWILLLVTYRHGLRAGEAVRIRRRDLEGGVLRIRRQKGSESTEQPLLGHENPLLNEADAVRIWLAEMGQRGKKGTAKPGGRRSRAKISKSLQKLKFRTEDDGQQLLFPLPRPGSGKSSASTPLP